MTLPAAICFAISMSVPPCSAELKSTMMPSLIHHGKTRGEIAYDYVVYLLFFGNYSALKTFIVSTDGRDDINSGDLPSNNSVKASVAVMPCFLHVDK